MLSSGALIRVLNPGPSSTGSIDYYRSARYDDIYNIHYTRARVYHRRSLTSRPRRSRVYAPRERTTGDVDERHSAGSPRPSRLTRQSKGRLRSNLRPRIVLIEICLETPNNVNGTADKIDFKPNSTDFMQVLKSDALDITRERFVVKTRQAKNIPNVLERFRGSSRSHYIIIRFFLSFSVNI